MPNKFDQHGLLERLNLDKDAELMSHDLNEILERELSKPAAQVDVQLVDELLDLLNAENPDAAEKEACWQEMQKAMPAPKKRSWARVFKRMAAAAAVVVVLFFVSFESARAFRWTFLLKLLTPVAETFGIYSASTFDSEQTVQDNAALQNVDTGYEQVNYATLADMPAEKDGHRTVLAWAPERFAFIQGSVYEDPDMAYITASYESDGDFIILNTSIFYNDDAVFAYEYERTLNEPITEDILGRTISYYHNLDEDKLSASWINDDAHYHLFGNVTNAELKQMITSMLE